MRYVFWGALGAGSFESVTEVSCILDRSERTNRKIEALVFRATLERIGANDGLTLAQQCRMPVLQRAEKSKCFIAISVPRKPYDISLGEVWRRVRLRSRKLFTASSGQSIRPMQHESAGDGDQ